MRRRTSTKTLSITVEILQQAFPSSLTLPGTALEGQADAN